MDMFFAAVKEMDPSHALGAGFMLAGSFAFVGFLAFLEYLLTSVGYCKALQKASPAGRPSSPSTTLSSSSSCPGPAVCSS